MICEPCKEGGKWNRAFLKAQTWAGREANAMQAAANHARCPGGTRCDCQHLIGTAVATGGEPK